MKAMRVTCAMVTMSATLFVAGCGEDSPPPQAAVVTAEKIAAHAKHAAGGEPLPCCPPVDARATTQAASEGTPAALATAAAPEPQPAPEPAAEPAPTASDGQSRRGDWAAPADRVPFHLDYTLTNQDGQPVSLASFRGKPTVITFFFTTCPLPQMCPLIVTTTAKLQEQLAASGLDDDTQILLISYDPKRDTPAAMKTYGHDRGLTFTNASMLVPKGEDLRNLIHEFQIGVQYYADGSIGHFIELLVMDKQGRFVRDYTGSIWDNAQVLDDLRRLADEP